MHSKSVCLIIFFFFCALPSCYSQKSPRRDTGELKKIELNTQQFIGKPLCILLQEIQPRIKYVYGNPENKWKGEIGGTYLRFHFINKTEYGEQLRKNKKPSALVVTFQLEPNNTRKPLPKEGLTEWKDEHTQEYGDMIILNIRVVEDN